MNTQLIIIVLIEMVLVLLYLQKQVKRAARFISWLFFIIVTITIFLAFFTQQTAPTFQGFTSSFLSFILLFFIVFRKTTELSRQDFNSLYYAIMSGLLGFVILQVFLQPIQPYKVFYVQLSDINTRQLALYLLIIETAYLVGLAAMVGQTCIEQKNFFLTLIQYTLVFSIFLTIELFQRPPEVTTLLPYENLFALLISLFCGLIFWGVFQKNGILRRILAGFILIVPLYFVVINSD
jgi:hypothetical protein